MFFANCIFSLTGLAIISIPAADAFVAMPPSTTTATSSSSFRESNAESADSSLRLDMENVKACIFDIDGTLADSWKLGWDATNVVLQNHGKDAISEEEYHIGCKYTTPERLARHVGLQPGDADFESMGAILGQEFDSRYVELVNMETAGFYPGMSDLLDQLVTANVALGALTNACVAYAHAVMRVNCGEDKEKMFGSVQGADSVERPKPHPDGLWQVCRELGVSPSECVYVGDSPSDGSAAVAAGMPAIGVLWGSNDRSTLEKVGAFAHICSSVDELTILLRPPSSPKVVTGEEIATASQ